MDVVERVEVVALVERQQKVSAASRGSSPLLSPFSTVLCPSVGLTRLPLARAPDRSLRLSTLLLDGMASPATYRLWGKKRWDGAREMIERANASSGWTKPTPEEIQGLLAGEGGRFGDNGNGIGDKHSANRDQA